MEHYYKVNQMCDLKIDLDNKDIEAWAKNIFYPTYKFLRYTGLKINNTSLVYRTKRGYHIYFNTNCISYSQILLIESFLGSDIRKQLYAYVEGNDILFRNKNQGESKEVYSFDRSLWLDSIVSDINKLKLSQRIVSFDTKVTKCKKRTRR